MIVQCWDLTLYSWFWLPCTALLSHSQNDDCILSFLDHRFSDPERVNYKFESGTWWVAEYYSFEPWICSYLEHLNPLRFFLTLLKPVYHFSLLGQLLLKASRWDKNLVKCWIFNCSLTQGYPLFVILTIAFMSLPSLKGKSGLESYAGNGKVMY